MSGGETGSEALRDLSVPIVIRKATVEDKTSKRYVVISGRRRVRATKTVGKSTIRARFRGETEVIDVPIDDLELRVAC